MKFSLISKAAFFPLFCGYFFPLAVVAETVVEDFSSRAHLDATASTGFWNIEARRAEAIAVAGAEAARPLNFGDGSDGIVDSANGFDFDTDEHPAGYHFVSLSISAGTITVRGSNPLVIRSLGPVTIVPNLSLRGENGINGSVGGSIAGGGAALACGSSGGSGGQATDTVAGSGESGRRYDGVEDSAATGGAGHTALTAGEDGNGTIPFAASPDEFDTGNFLCGSGGGGGGSHSAVAQYGGGGGGGAGGGAVHIVAAGDLTVGTIDASGGNGGSGINDGSRCSGAGAGGVGGSVWLQTRGTLVAPTPLVDGGTGGAGGGAGCTVVGVAVLGGFYRGDSAVGARPGWATGVGNYDTDSAVPAQVYTLQSTAYDLGTTNAGFTEEPTVESEAGGGSVLVEYAGSQNGSDFSEFVPTLSSLSNRLYRYVRFRITITTASAAAASPRVTRITIPYRELDLKLSGGCVCGTTARPAGNEPEWLSTLFWLALWAVARRVFSRGPKAAF